MKRQFYLGIAASILCLSQLTNIDTAQAQVCQENVAENCLKINTQALQDFMKLNDIVPQNLVQQSEVGQLTELTSAPLNKGSLLTAPKQITRTINNLWMREVTSGTENNFIANYQCSNNNFIHSNQPSSSIQVVNIEPTPITVAPEPASAPDKVVIQGGAIFTFDLTNTKASGNHSCDLEISVSEK